ncbi:hypothetical protein F5884DRAFT_788716 [Xylogone sp. PMI_703]|nr:hypothetical protein F5884DRAFT_788716 [Xylogone sp. PMI_703]
MRASVATSLLALSASALAQYDTASAPFALVVSSINADYNNKALSPCHEGAAIEALCLGNTFDKTNAPTYTFNTSASAPLPDNGGTSAGLLIYSLPVSGQLAPSAFGLTFNPASNIAVPLFEPGVDSATYVAFDGSDRLNIPAAIDNGTGQTTSGPFYMWQICQTFVGYKYTTLAWQAGLGTPTNPTCQGVSVKRVFV